jgi:pyrroloquinoline quinone biosynthesis protein B
LIRIRILGSAAGGGLPQWNCLCANCAAARKGEIAPQTQSSVAVSADDQRWFLVNASPDLPRQIESAPALQPQPGSLRNSPIAGVLLTNADLDHTLGLLLLRQQQTPVLVYASDATRSALDWLELLLHPFGGSTWRTASGDFNSLSNGLAFRAIELHKSNAFQLRDEVSGRAALVAPVVGELTAELRDAVNTSDVILFDGTFWNDDELRAVRRDARSAREMNHLPISDSSLALLRHSPARRKIYMHINNTNPILMPGSRERALVQQAGIEIACDGLEIIL